MAGQGAAKVAEPMAKRKYDEVNSSLQGSNQGLDPQPNPSLSSGQAAYGGWYPNLPSDSKSSSTSKGGDGSDPNAIDI